MADKETIRYFKQFSESEDKQETIDFAKVLSAKLNWSSSQRQMFNGLLSNLSRKDIKIKEYIKTKKDMETMITRSIDETVDDKPISKKLSLGRKIANLAGIGVLAAGLYGATPAHGQESSGVTTSGTTNVSPGVTCSTPGVDYEKIAQQIDDLNVGRNHRKALETAQPYMDDPCNNNGHLFIEIGGAYAWLNKFKDAEKYLLMGVKFDPKRQSGHNYLGYVYSKTGRIEKAKNEFRISIEIDSTTEAGEQAQRLLNRL